MTENNNNEREEGEREEERNESSMEGQMECLEEGKILEGGRKGG